MCILFWTSTWIWHKFALDFFFEQKSAFHSIIWVFHGQEQNPTPLPATPLEMRARKYELLYLTIFHYWAKIGEAIYFFWSKFHLEFVNISARIPGSSAFSNRKHLRNSIFKNQIVVDFQECLQGMLQGIFQGMLLQEFYRKFSLNSPGNSP